jgi:hypothetical protein
MKWFGKSKDSNSIEVNQHQHNHHHVDTAFKSRRPKEDTSSIRIKITRFWRFVKSSCGKKCDRDKKGNDRNVCVTHERPDCHQTRPKQVMNHRKHDQLEVKTVYKTHCCLSASDQLDVNKRVSPVKIIQWSKILCMKNMPCAVCLEVVGDGVAVTECECVLCNECALVWITYSSHCPACKKAFTRLGHHFHSVERYQVAVIEQDQDKFTESLAAAYLLPSYRSNWTILRTIHFELEALRKRVETLREKAACVDDGVEMSMIEEMIADTQMSIKETEKARKSREKGRDEIAKMVDPCLVKYWNSKMQDRNTYSRIISLSTLFSPSIRKYYV